MQTRQNTADLTIRFGHAEATRLRLIELQGAAHLDFPCSLLLVDPAALGSVLGMDTIRPAQLTQWLMLVERGYLYELARASAKERGTAGSAYDALPNLENHLRTYQDGNSILLAFAERLLAIDDVRRRACVVQLNGAPPDSELGEFAPHRRGLIRGIGGTTVSEEKCDPSAHACAIQLALKAIGPTAIVGQIGQLRVQAESFRHVWCLGTQHWIPYLWTGQGDPRRLLSDLYVAECAQAVRYEYDEWLTKAPAHLEDDDPVLRWLVTPSGANRMVALSFVLRRAAGARHQQHWLTVGECADLLLEVVSGIDRKKAMARVSEAAGRRFTTNGKKGSARRVDRDSFSTWLLEQRKRDLDADNEGH